MKIVQTLLPPLVVAVLALSFQTSSSAGDPVPKGKRILYFTKSAGFEHSVVKRPDNGGLSHSEQVLTDLGKAHGFQVTCTKDGTVFTKSNLAKYDVIAFYTSGLLTETGTDKTPAMSLEGKSALLQAIQKGKGFVGIHAANDSFHVQPDPMDKSGRFKSFGDGVDPYIKMVGGEFIRHGPQQVATQRVADPTFPGCESLGATWALQDEWYTFKDFAKDLHVILVMETRGMKGIDYQRASFPATWAHRYGKGRSFYTSMGHREDVWTNPQFQKVLLGGLAWAAGSAKADVKPNLAKETPGYAEIQPMEESWTDLMPGANLAGWYRVPVPPGGKLGRDQWHVDAEKKLLICDGDGGHDMLLTEKEYGDAVFHFEFCYTKVEGKTGYNSGAYVRNSKDGAIWHQAQFGDAKDGFLFGETPTADGKKQFFNLAKLVKDPGVKPAGEWNVMEVTARGKTLTLSVNGKVTCKFEGCNAEKGHLGLEGEGYRIEFRNLKVKELY
jgi:type 1 glutamine amidotransferase